MMSLYIPELWYITEMVSVNDKQLQKKMNLQECLHVARCPNPRNPQPPSIPTGSHSALNVFLHIDEAGTKLV